MVAAQQFSLFGADASKSTQVEIHYSSEQHERRSTVWTLEFIRIQMAKRRLARCTHKLFLSQTKVDEFEVFNNILKISAGWCVWVPGPNGGIMPIAKPDNYKNCSADKIAEITQQIRHFALTKNAHKYFWPGLIDIRHQNLIRECFGEPNA